MNNGWIKLHRKLKDNKLWLCEPFTRGQAWVDLLMLANHEDNFFYCREHKIEVKRGAVGWSQIKLAERWRWSRTKTRKFLNDLEKEQQVRQQLSHSYSIIEIVNYKDYQEKKTTGHTTGKQQENTNKNDKNDKKIRNKKSLLSKVDESTLDPETKKYYQIAISFWELVKSNLKELDISNSEIDKAKFKTWVDPIRLLIERDEHTIEEFREIFLFLQKDDFWKEQIRSTTKLRKKNKEDIPYFEVLLTKSRNEQKRKDRKESSEREKQSGVSDNYRKSILERLRNPNGTEATQKD